MPTEEIYAAIPHREPFLFVDRIVERTPRRIVCEKTFHPTEDFFRGHYPDFPLVPGVLLCEAAMQAGAILLRHSLPTGDSFQNKMPVVAKMNDIRFRQSVRPGETIRITVEHLDSVSNAHTMAATVTVCGKLSVKLTFVVMLVEKNG
ncbi:MAG: 3-hydroxyacyl-ACP dehydratase FabZ family protein [Planctomycetia bacterium]|nr:3-hydroxyacyl-ACP dehydratase FabZ family protein [Planctomycetia bacterium]